MNSYMSVLAKTPLFKLSRKTGSPQSFARQPDAFPHAALQLPLHDLQYLEEAR